MSIEIKQLLIKSNVADDVDDEEIDVDEISTTTIKNEILGECRRLIMDILNEKGQR